MLRVHQPKIYFMRQLFFTLSILFLTACATAQSSPTIVKYNKTSKPALMLLLPYTEEIAEGAIVQKLKEIGYNPESKGSLFWKKNTIDGYYVFKGVALRDLNGEVVDLYFKVNRKSKKENGQSYIYMMVSKGDEQFVSSETEPSVFSSSTRFLNSFTEYGASYKMDVDIQNQDEAVQAAQKKYTRLRDDEADYVKKIADLESKLKNNREQQDTQLKVIEAEKKKLEDLRAKKQNSL
jgi:hypothetical protein